MAQVRKNHFDNTVQPQNEGDPMPMDVGHQMVKSGKAMHPHWRHGANGKAHAKRMYSNADMAHNHTKIRP